MIDLGMSRKEYYEFLRDVETALYDPEDLQPFEDFEIYEDRDHIFRFTPYKGRKHKSYSQPMMELKESSCGVDSEKGYCHRCEGSSFWTYDTETVIRVWWYPVFRGPCGGKSSKPIHFIPYFAARRSHP